MVFIKVMKIKIFLTQTHKIIYYRLLIYTYYYSKRLTEQSSALKHSNLKKLSTLILGSYKLKLYFVRLIYTLVIILLSKTIIL